MVVEVVVVEGRKKKVKMEKEVEAGVDEDY